ncbi:hypothetical protein V1517DRAFT_367259 [Lipomyces orientalis]|uniref:Uncharacterized protein n=1 Tax=Lipomyces orientalis TaxID=1233043 RepID=A0ACC3TQJ1_9ASCO
MPFCIRPSITAPVPATTSSIPVVIVPSSPVPSSQQSSESHDVQNLDTDNVQPKSHKRKRENHDERRKGRARAPGPVIITLSDDEGEAPWVLDTHKNLQEKNEPGRFNWTPKSNDSPVHEEPVSSSPITSPITLSQTAALETNEGDSLLSADAVYNEDNINLFGSLISIPADQESAPATSLPTPEAEMPDPRAKLEKEVLAMFPDICRDFLQKQVSAVAPDFGPNKLQEIVLGILENPKYPRHENKPSSAAISADTERKAGDASDAEYVIAVKSALRHEFRTLPVRAIDQFVHQNKLSLNKAYEALDKVARYFVGDTSALPSKPRFQPLRAARSAKAEMDFLLGLKFGQQAIQDLDAVKEQLRVERLKEAENNDKQFAVQLAEREAEELGMTLTCGCCFGDYADFEMSQCSEGHLFCQACIQRQIENIIGLKQYKLKCIEVGGCEGVFVKSEIRRFIPDKLLEVLDKNQQQAELLESGLMLDHCPLCDFAICIENEDEKEFRCQNHECLAVTCRQCRKKTHIPQSCEEYERDLAKEDGLTARHQVEEAMTQALLRECTKCRQRFYKEDGCNKMTCSNCHNTMCYVCNKAIIGYDHFGNRGKCPLYDDTRKRHQEEISRAEAAAKQQVLQDNQNIYEEDIVVPEGRPMLVRNALARIPPAPADVRVMRDVAERRGQLTGQRRAWDYGGEYGGDYEEPNVEYDEEELGIRFGRGIINGQRGANGQSGARPSVRAARRRPYPS